MTRYGGSRTARRGCFFVMRASGARFGWIGSCIYSTSVWAATRAAGWQACPKKSCLRPSRCGASEIWRGPFRWKRPAAGRSGMRCRALPSALRLRPAAWRLAKEINFRTYEELLYIPENIASSPYGNLLTNSTYQNDSAFPFISAIQEPPLSRTKASTR